MAGPSFLHNDPHGANVARVADLCVVEHVYPHVKIAPGNEIVIVFAAGSQRPHRFEVPVAIAPACRPANISAIANDVGVEVVFLRQLIAQARPDDTQFKPLTEQDVADLVALVASWRQNHATRVKP